MLKYVYSNKSEHFFFPLPSHFGSSALTTTKSHFYFVTLFVPNFPFSIYILRMPPKSRIVETRSRSEACIAEVRSQSAKKMDDIWQQLQQKHGRNNLYIEDEELESFATKKELRLNGQGEPVFSPCHFKLLPKRILEDYPIHEAMLSRRDPTLQDYADYDQIHMGYTGGSVSGWLSHKHHADQITHYLENQILKVPRKVPGQDRAHPGVRLIKLTNLELVLYVNGKAP